MSLEKKVFTEKHFKGEFQHVEVNVVTCIMENGVEISRNNHRSTCLCGDDAKATELGIKSQTDVVWTTEVRDKYQLVMDDLNAQLEIEKQKAIEANK